MEHADRYPPLPVEHSRRAGPSLGERDFDGHPDRPTAQQVSDQGPQRHGREEGIQPDPEPPAQDSPLYTMPNVILTPHIAGSMGRECRRMGRLAMEECQRFLKGEPPLHAITEENFHRLA